MPGAEQASIHGAAGCSDARRFQLELEFVQCLASPDYLNCANTTSALCCEIVQGLSGLSHMLQGCWLQGWRNLAL